MPQPPRTDTLVLAGLIVAIAGFFYNAVSEIQDDLRVLATAASENATKISRVEGQLEGMDGRLQMVNTRVESHVHRRSNEPAVTVNVEDQTLLEGAVDAAGDVIEGTVETLGDALDDVGDILGF